MKGYDAWKTTDPADLPQHPKPDAWERHVDRYLDDGLEFRVPSLTPDPFFVRAAKDWKEANR